VRVMKQQRMGGAIFFPTLGVGMEEALSDDPPAVTAAFNAFNEWLHEDWGYAYKDMIFAAPYISLMDRENAIAQLEKALARDARAIVMRPAPVRLPGLSRSLADPYYDPFWARVNEAGITVAMHGGDSGYGRYFADWGEGGDIESFKMSPWKSVVGATRAPFDTMAALVCHGLFQRFPRLRVCSIEMGANWVPWLIQSFRRAYGISPKDFPEDPVETLKRHVWISPFHEDDVAALRELIGADRLLMGSDWPHAEGLADPSDFVRELTAFSPAEQRLVMRDNAAGLVQRA
jgi:predicted TIM-barrel fold metal-dependent hydrolase